MPTRHIAMMSLARNRSATRQLHPFEIAMKLQLNGGDWATLAFFALAMTLGCYAESVRTSAQQPHVQRGQELLRVGLR